MRKLRNGQNGIGICKLCLKKAKLCDSHIIPEFLYQPLYDSKHRIIVATTLPNERNPYIQKGLREELLCAACETHLSKFEGYAREVLYGNHQIRASRQGRVVIAEGIDYAKFRIFQLSILWRAGVASGEDFSAVNLGPHAEVLRHYIHAGIPPPPRRYPCIITRLIYDRKVFEDFILPPSEIKIDGHRGYRFVFGGGIWVYVVSSHQLNPILDKICLGEDGILRFLDKEVFETPFLQALAHNFAKAKKEKT